MTNLNKEELGLRRHGKLRQQGGSGRKSTGKSRSTSSGGTRAFAIMRTAKIKALANISASLSHTFRERDTPNADPDRIHDNTVLVGADNAAGVMQSWYDRAPDKIRKNAVHGLEYFVGGSPEHINSMSRQEQDQYFTKALDWLKDRHGAENILSAVIHRDETTPHLTVMTIPLDDKGKLNARHFVGSRKDLSELQTNFAQSVGQEFGFERGLKRSQAKHQRVKRFYDTLQDTPETAVTLPERDLGGFMGIGKEKDAEWRQRASRAAENALVGQKAAFDKKIRGLENQVRQKDHELRVKDYELELSHERNDTRSKDQEVYHGNHVYWKKAMRVLVHLGIEDMDDFEARYLKTTSEENQIKDQETLGETHQREQREKQIEQDNLRDRKLERKIQDIRDQDLDDDYGLEF